VLIGFGYLVHTYQWLIGVPDICGIVYNASNFDDTLPREGRLDIYESTNSTKSIFNANFLIWDPQVEIGDSESVLVKPQEKRRIELRPDLITNPMRKDHYKYYRIGNTHVALTFFPARRREFTLERIPFNKKTLKGEDSLFTFDLISKEDPWRSPCLKVCFATNEEKVDPNDRRNLEITKKLLEREAMRRGWFRIVSCKKFEEYRKRFDAYEKRHKRERVNIAVGRNPALRYLDWPTVVQVIVGFSQKDSQTQWISVMDAQYRIPKEKDEKEGEWPVHFGETQDQMKEEIETIVDRLRRTIVRYYPIRGQITRIVEKDDYRMAILNVGSAMGVTENTRFDVLSEGTDRPTATGATVEIKVVSIGEEARGFLKNGDDIVEGARVRSTEE
jgi:hypothetical protein